MKVLVEGYPYQSEQATRLLKLFETKQTTKGLSSDCVGYCFSKEIGDCVFFLPKVILDRSDKIFDTFSPEEIVDVNESELKDEQLEFLNGLSIWIYRALKQFRNNNPESLIVDEKSFSEIGNGESVLGTLLDVALSLVKFYKENKDFFIYTLKNIHSQNHKINWAKTISHTQAIVQNDIPLYIDPISKKKEVNWDEELIIIFFSILNYLNKYGFRLPIPYNYDLIVGDLFNAYIDGLGLRKLRQIKYKYFSDKTRQLWALCYSFFLKADEISSSKSDSDYLMATNFHVVFEAIVDDLLGDSKYDEWKQIGDGKIIDHIFKYESLFSPDQTFYIGDSKYYQTKRSVDERSESALKQFTYARSIVNNSIKQSIGNTWPYRDPLTEGYSVTPNFFISAETDRDLRYDVDGLDRDDLHGTAFVSRQFVNRLFDRDTLWVRQYNLNFLYLLSVYASGEETAKKHLKDKVRKFFRCQTIDLLNDHYSFYVLEPKNNSSLDCVMIDSVKWLLRGMVYRLGQSDNQLILAIQLPCENAEEIEELDENLRIHEDLVKIREIIPRIFDFHQCKLSKIPGVYYETITNEETNLLVAKK